MLYIPSLLCIQDLYLLNLQLQARRNTMSFDYSKITIYQDNTKCPQTIKLNSRLLSLYKKWFFVMQNKGLNNLGNLTIGKH